MRIIIEELTFGYGGKPLFKKLTLSIDRFPCALIGPNGIGKTTLLDLMAKILEPTKGRISFKPSDVVIGYVPQFAIYLPWLTVYENFQNLGISGVLLEQLKEIDSDFWTDNKQKFPDELSGGNLKKLSIIMAIANLKKRNNNNNTLLIVDEPLNALDSGSRRSYSKIMNEYNLIIVSHQSDIKEYFNNCQELRLSKQQNYTVISGEVHKK